MIWKSGTINNWLEIFLNVHDIGCKGDYTVSLF